MHKLVECLPRTGELWGLLSQEDQEFTSILNYYVDCVKPAWIHEICERERNGGRKGGGEGTKKRKRVGRTEGETEEGKWHFSWRGLTDYKLSVFLSPQLHLCNRGLFCLQNLSLEFQFWPEFWEEEILHLEKQSWSEINSKSFVLKFDVHHPIDWH